MSDGGRGEAERARPFDGIDPKLNMYALANGMDLAKEPRQRRLEWFTEGLERAIVIEAESDDGVFRVGVVSWRTGTDEIVASASVGGGLSATDVMVLLDPAIETANALEANEQV